MNLARMAKHNRDAPDGPRPWHPKRNTPPPGDRMRRHAHALATPPTTKGKTSDD